MKRLMVGLVAVGGIIGIGGSAVSAAPEGGEALTLHCDRLGTIEITTGPGRGLWTPGFVAGTNQRLNPHAFRFEFNGMVEEVSKPAPESGRLDRCTFSEVDEEGAFNGTVWLSYTPK